MVKNFKLNIQITRDPARNCPNNSCALIYKFVLHNLLIIFQNAFLALLMQFHAF